MVWQSQFKSGSPRGKVSEITDGKKMFAQFGLEEESRYYTVTKNNIISGSQKKICLSGCWRMPNSGRENARPGIHWKAIALIGTVGNLQYFLNWWKLIVNFWSGAISVIFQICEPETSNKYFKYLHENQTCYLNSSCWKLATKLFQCGCRALILVSSCNPKLVLTLLTSQRKCMDICIFHNYSESNSRNWNHIFRIKIEEISRIK